MLFRSILKTLKHRRAPPRHENHLAASPGPRGPHAPGRHLLSPKNVLSRRFVVSLRSLYHDRPLHDRQNNRGRRKVTRRRLRAIHPRAKTRRPRGGRSRDFLPGSFAGRRMRKARTRGTNLRTPRLQSCTSRTGRTASRKRPHGSRSRGSCRSAPSAERRHTRRGEQGDRAEPGVAAAPEIGRAHV